MFIIKVNPDPHDGFIGRIFGSKYSTRTAKLFGFVVQGISYQQGPVILNKMTLISEGEILESNFPPEMIWISSVIINIFANATKSLFITIPHPEMLHHIYAEGASPSMCSLLKKKFSRTNDPPKMML